MAEEQRKDGIRFVAAGDVFLSGKVAYKDGTSQEVISYKPEAVFQDVAPIFRNTDVVFCNLESALADRGTPPRDRIGCFMSRPENVKLLKEAKIDVVSFANNHSMDFGPEAMFQTLSLLDQHGIAHAGAGANITEARKPAFVKKKGTTFAFLAYATNINTPGWFSARPKRAGLAYIRLHPYFAPPHVTKEDLRAMELDIKEAKEKADFVIVSCHWGVSQGGTYSVAPHQSAIGQTAISAGAELVLGHHQHAYQGVELYQGKMICHGLGNFIFDTLDAPFFPETVLFHCTFQKGGIGEAWLQPIIQDDHAHPHPLPPEDENSRRILSQLKELSSELGTKIKIEGGNAHIVLGKSKR